MEQVSKQTLPYEELNKVLIFSVSQESKDGIEMQVFQVPLFFFC